MFFRITLSQNLEYEPNPKDYPEGSSFEEMLMLDLENAKEEPELFFHKSNHVIVGKIITEESKAIDTCLKAIVDAYQRMSTNRDAEYRNKQLKFCERQLEKITQINEVMVDDGN